MATEVNGHWTRFVQGVKTAFQTLTLRTYLKIGDGLIVQDDPANDAYLLSVDASSIAKTSWKTYADGRAIVNVDINNPPTPIGGVALADGTRYLLTAQTDQTENGIYYYEINQAKLIRSADADTDLDLRAAEITIRRGDGAGQRWRCMNTGPAAPGVNAITFELREANGDKAKLDALISCTWPNIVAAGAAAALDLSINGVEIKNAKDPTTAQSLVTRQFYFDNLPAAGVSSVSGSDPIGVNNAVPSAPVVQWAPGADVPMSAHGFTACTGIANGAGAVSISGSGAVSVASTGGATSVTAGGGALTLDASAAVNLATSSGTAVNIGHGTIQTTITGTVYVMLSGIGTTKTRAFTIGNDTVSGSQVSGQLGFYAFHSGGTRLNAGIQLEPQSASRALMVLYYGTGTGVPANTGTYFDNLDPDFGSGVVADCIICRGTSTTGFRFGNTNNKGGMDLNGSYWLRLKSYNTKGISLETGADAGGSGGVERLWIGPTGLGRAPFVAHGPTSASGALSIDLGKSQNILHAATENTTVAFTGGTPGQQGIIEFTQGGTGYTVTLPNHGTGVEYDATILSLGLTAIVSNSTYTRTILAYYVLASGRPYIYLRSVSAIS